MKSPRKLPVGSDADMQAILDHATEAFVLVGASGIIRAFNKQAKEFIIKNVSLEVTKGSSLYDYLDPARHAGYAKLLQRVSNGETIQYDRSYERPNGKIALFEFLMSPVFHKGIIDAICIRARDVTEMRESEKLYQLLFDEEPLPKFVCDRRTLHYLEVNKAAVKHYGYTREELLDMSVFDIRVKEEHDALQFTVDHGPAAWNKNFVGHHRKKNGEIISVQVALHPVNFKGVEATLIVVSDVTLLLQLDEQLAEEKLNKQQQVTRATIEAQEKERMMLGSELHDNVNQMLSSAKMFLGYAITAPEEQEVVIQKSIDTLDKCIEEIRKLSRTLVPPSLGDIGLKQAILDLVKAMSIANCVIKYRGLRSIKESQLPKDMKLCIYRIIQEQLTNIAKYAQCTRIDLVFERMPTCLEITIADNGLGFDAKAKRKGVGLTNIANRAAAFNGKMMVDSKIGKGTMLTVRFPI